MRAASNGLYGKSVNSIKGWPSAIVSAKRSTWSLPIELLCVFMFAMCIVMHLAVRIWRVDKIKESISLWGGCCMVLGPWMYLWMRLWEQVLSDRTAWWPNLSQSSIIASSVLLMVCCVCGVEVTRILREEREEPRMGG
jgi:hypothetical protein